MSYLIYAPTRVLFGADFARTAGCDSIITLGGGSVMDAAKSIAIMATHRLPVPYHRAGQAPAGLRHGRFKDV